MGSDCYAKFWKVNKVHLFTFSMKMVNVKTGKYLQGCALAEPGGPWRPTFILGRLENLRFFIQIICWAP